MEHAKKYLEYAGAFEQTFEDNDWTRLEKFFTEDAVFDSEGEPPLGGRSEGRPNVLDQLRSSVDGLDRRFDARSVELVGEPKLGANDVFIEWRATYERANCPDLVFLGTERATFEGDRIRLLEDTVEAGADERIQEYLKRFFD